MSFEIKARIAISPESSCETRLAILDGVEWLLEEKLQGVHDIYVGSEKRLTVGVELCSVELQHGYEKNDETYFQEED